MLVLLPQDDGDEDEWDGVVDREFIKHRASKVSARQQALSIKA
jgi:hypothetical protein